MWRRDHNHEAFIGGLDVGVFNLGVEVKIEDALPAYQDTLGREKPPE